ncbi:MAG: subtype A tannase [Lactimicrobium sp.]|jgi:hypothetical protein|uniref:subtype A tannase n=1 Tax=Lactimicrobium sp. TaxID=2563780 RepID=UPI002F356B99
MKKHWGINSIALLMTGSLLLVGCSSSAAATASADASATDVSSTLSLSSLSSGQITTTLAKIDNTKWLYNSDDNVYYQLGIQYCGTPADANVEQLAIFVPGAYMNATDNGDGTYTCTLNTSNTISGYTASTAPIVMPVNTPGYSQQDALTEYTSSVTDYTSAGFIYVHAGCRGRDAGAPAGVTDLKAAVRYLRYNSGNIPGDTESIFSFGMSGGGALSVLLGTTGDNALYGPYLTAIGAVTGVSDAIKGSQGWCPITSLDSADEAYEWNMGTTRSNLSEEEQTISSDLTEAFATYINSIGLTDTNGNILTLEQSDDGNYQAGSYYDYIKSVIEESLNNFLSDTTFPYTASSSNAQGGAPSGNAPSGSAPGNGGSAPDMSSSATTNSDSSSPQSQESIDNISRTENTSGIALSGTYETVQDYIDALNANGTWVNYDAETNTATITSISDFAKAVKTASKSLGAFDQLDDGQGENTLFGYGDGSGAHFDSLLAEILANEGSSYASDYANDMTRTDSAGNTVSTRVNMYSPLYYLLPSSAGYNTSKVASCFRINTGIFQSDTALTTEANLVLALQNYGADTDYSFVWGLDHTMAERSGESTANFIAWVNECMGTQA